jgi:hypothetical protein
MELCAFFHAYFRRKEKVTDLFFREELKEQSEAPVISPRYILLVMNATGSGCLECPMKPACFEKPRTEMFCSLIFYT